MDAYQERIYRNRSVVMEIFAVLSKVFTLMFVVASMLALGFSLTVGQIVSPLRDVRLVLRALVANFVLVPAAAYGIKMIIPIGDSYGTGLLILATAAGAAVLPKLVQLAKGDVAFGAGVMVLLTVVTVAYVPIVLPLLLSGVSVNPLDIAKSLVGLMGLIATMLLLNWRTLFETIGTGALLAALLFIVVSFVFGYMAGTSATTKPVLALGTAQRNIAAA